MTDARDLYQEVILDHYKRPRNFGPLPDADHKANGHNPLCGDRVTIYLSLKGDTLREVHFEGSGCAISTASASIMTEALKGKTQKEAEKLFDTFHNLVTGKPAESSNLGKLAAFSGVSEYPARVKCASLAWHTLKAALENKNATVTTEKEI
ncbi:MAG TPA: SUF system NifU family Fe-S cluster assembly protein [Bdellovibrionota bacterium]|nr:SUF system NifU family Fe-S cluster assembly protein [Bdellovibrionota bacterium]